MVITALQRFAYRHDVTFPTLWFYCADQDTFTAFFPEPI